MRRPFEKNHFVWLTLAMVAMMVVSALSDEIRAGLTLQLIEYSSVTLLMLSLLSLKSHRKWTKAFVTIIGIMLIVVVARGVTKYHHFEYAYLGLLLIFMVSSSWLVGKQVLLTGTVDVNTIVGSIALYFLIGFIWSIFYTLLIEFKPGSLSGIEVGPWYDSLSSTTYFSFVTLTTLGFGDIHPVGPFARVLVILEAITGMFYMAVVVASLIGARRNNG